MDRNYSIERGRDMRTVGGLPLSGRERVVLSGWEEGKRAENVPTHPHRTGGGRRVYAHCYGVEMEGN